MENKIYKPREKTATQGKWLYNEKDNIITDKIYLGIFANINDWVEITEEKKQEIEKSMNEEIII